ASASTFVATLFLPIQVAVGIGVVLSAILYLNESSAEISVVQMVERPDGRIEERKSPKRLPSNQVTMLNVYGALSHAGARTLERLLPSPRDAQRPVVVLRLRGLTTVGATLIDVLATYAEQLQAAHGRLYLAGISDEARDQLAHSDTLHHSRAARIYEATSIVGQSAREAYADARAWLESQNTTASSDEYSIN
ncbi:MAG TPA: STAS domain-containing protein, partial [Ktedonobacterales bacterium]|nr:STAS domain-containing protein [Ktedonobacterales bacterium]